MAKKKVNGIVPVNHDPQALEWKVAWEALDGGYETFWLTEQEARKKYDKLKNETLLKTIWAELIFASEDEYATDKVIVVESFTRPTMTLAGHKIITGK